MKNVILNVNLRFTSIALALAAIPNLEKLATIENLNLHADNYDGGPAIGSAGAQTSIAANVATAADTAPAPAAEPEKVTTGKGTPKADKSKPAAPAADTATAGNKDDASAQTPKSDTPSTSETQSGAGKVLTYADSDLPGRIQAIVEDAKKSGDKTKKDALVSALGALGLKTAKDLKPEQIEAFSVTLKGIEAGDDADLG